MRKHFVYSYKDINYLFSSLQGVAWVGRSHQSGQRLARLSTTWVEFARHDLGGRIIKDVTRVAKGLQGSPSSGM